MGSSRKAGEHSELGEKAVSGSLDPIMSSSPAFTSPNEYGGFSDLGMGSDDMGRTIENLVYTEIPYGKFKNMTPEDYEQIVNLYKDDPKLRMQLLNKYKEITNKKIVFIIGGAYGFSNEIYNRSNKVLSFSSMTFTHQMIRLFFLEQLYRGFSILSNQPYHHE